MHTLVCGECNMQLPLACTNDGIAFMTRLINVARFHNCASLVSCVVFFFRNPVGVEYVTVHGIALKSRIPLSCSHCALPFVSALDIERHQLCEHQQVITKLKCPNCPHFFATQLFYREHLLTHLAETHSMVPLLDRVTFTAPASDSHATPRMGLRMEPVCGGYFSSALRVDYASEISEEEDLTEARDEASRKREETTWKAKGDKQRQAARRNYEGRCYACKQIRQITGKRSPCDLCTCDNSFTVKKSRSELSFVQGPPGSRLLTQSLCDKFTREGRLYVGSRDKMHDPTKGAILSSSVYYCVKCNAILLGNENTIRHLRICTQKDVASPNPEKEFDLNDTDVVVLLAHPLAPFNSRVCCPHCDKLSCSIPGLRRHIVVVHGFLAPFMPQGSAGIMECSGETKTLPNLSEMTNERLGLTKDGNFRVRPLPMLPRPPQKINANGGRLEHSQSPVAGISPRKILPSTIIRAFEGGESAAPANPSKPAKLCTVCFQNYQSASALARHFVSYHLHLCSECGQGYTEEAAKDVHKRTCKGWPTENANMFFLPHCSRCSYCAPSPQRYFFHFLHHHDDEIKIEKPSKQVLPMFIWKPVSYEEYQRKRQAVEAELTESRAKKALGPAPQPTTDIPQKLPLQPQQKVHLETTAEKYEAPHCYLCEKPYRGDPIGLDQHVRAHKEQWAACPVCVSTLTTFEVHSLQELFDHMITHHVQISGVAQGMKVTCLICCMCMPCTASEVLWCQEQMVRHILYSCNSVRRCLLCNDNGIMLPDDLKQHRAKVHKEIYERFGCSMCPKRFYMYSHFEKHICNTRVMCSCGNRVHYTEREFEAHFRVHLNRLGDFCLLCTKFLPTKPQQSSHRNSHRIVLVGHRSLLEYNALSHVSVTRQGPKRSAANAPVSPSAVALLPPAVEPPSSGDKFQFRTVKPDTNSDDDIIILETPPAASSTSTKTARPERRLSESATASSSISALMAEPPASEPAAATCAPVPIPRNFMCNVRVETDTAALQDSQPVCALSVEDAPAIEIALESDDEAVTAIVERLISTVCGTDEDFNEQLSNNPSDEDSRPAASQANDDEMEEGELETSTEEGGNPDNKTADEESRSHGAEEEGNAEGAEVEQGSGNVPEDDAMGAESDDDILIIDENELSHVEEPSPRKQLDNEVEQTSDKLQAALTVEGEVPGTSASPAVNGCVVEEPEDDDICFIEERKRPTDDECAAVEKVDAKVTVVEDNGDDDLQVVAEVEGGPGVEKLKKREKFYRCARCTSSFCTRAALAAHSESHRYDAGNTSDKVFGVPLDTTVYICRLCCLAYESHEVYVAHSNTHGNLFSCEQCAVVTFNDDQFKMHNAQHATSSNGNGSRIVYVCSQCVVTYSTDERLYHHMMTRHQLVVLYFCKYCGFANTNGKTVYWHIALAECAAMRNRGSSVATGPMGFTAACAFHFQPQSEAVYEARLLQNLVRAVAPSECVHRSFLMTQNDQVAITCTTCSVLMNYLRLSVEVPEFTSKLPRSISTAPDDNGAMMSRLTQLWRTPPGGGNAATTAASATAAPTAPRGRRQRATATISQSALPGPAAAPQTIVWRPPPITEAATAAAAARPATPVRRVRNSHPTGGRPSVPVAASPFVAAPPTAPSGILARGTSPGRQPVLNSQLNGYQASLASAIRVGETMVARRNTSPMSGSTTNALIRAAGQGTSSVPATNVRALLTSHTQGPTQAFRLSSPQISQFRFAPASTVQSRYTINHPDAPTTSHQAAGFQSTSAAADFDARRISHANVSNSDQNAQLPQSTDFIIRTPSGQLMCSRPECRDVRIEKSASGHVHNLRHNVHNTHFCLECGQAFHSEQLAVRHQIEFHHQNQLPTVFVRCPLCSNLPGFDSIEKLRAHLRDNTIGKHATLHYFLRLPKCSLFFATDEAKQAHENAHATAHSHDCCALCGTVQNYWTTPTYSNLPAMNHTLVHAFSMWGMCRECGLCFMNEVKKDQFIRHFSQSHMDAEPSRCRICKISVHERRVHEHALTMHFVVGMKTDRSRPFTVQSSDPLMLCYLGFNVPGNTRV